MIFTCCFLQCKPCNSSMVFDRTGRKFIVQEKNYNLQQQQKKPPKIQQPQIATITKKQQQQITKTKIEHHKKITTKIQQPKKLQTTFYRDHNTVGQLGYLSLSLTLYGYEKLEQVGVGGPGLGSPTIPGPQQAHTHLPVLVEVGVQSVRAVRDVMTRGRHTRVVRT